jgi:hypothetical protein
VFVIDEMAIGICGSFRMGQLLQYVTLPKHPTGMEDFQYMVTQMVPILRKLFQEGGFSKVENNVDVGGTFLIGYRGHLYGIYSDYQVQETALDYLAIGCGRDFALGCLANNPLLPAKARVIQAIETAEMFSAAVRSPIHIVSV